jgi:hypothetical protein
MSTVFEFERGEATPQAVSQVLSDIPEGATMKVLSYMNGDLRKITVTFPFDTPPAA